MQLFYLTLQNQNAMKSCSTPTLFLFLFILAFNPISSQAQCSPDTESPVAICQSAVNISLPASGSLMLDPAFFDAGSFDNCTNTGNLTFAVSPTSVSCADIGMPITVIMTVWDEVGNSNLCMSTAYVEDKISPLIVCEPQINISLPESGEFTLTSDVLLQSFSDNCDLTYSITPSEVNCSDIGAPFPYTITATDPGGNSTSCTGTLLVEDKLSFTLICEANINVSLPTNGLITLTPEMLVVFENDNCDLTYNISPNQLSCADAGSTVPVTITATDLGGNTNSCITNVFVVDQTQGSVTIVPPASIACGETGVIFNSTVSGGSAPYIYDWEIKKGASSGWAITSGQGTPSITVNAGTGKLKLNLEVNGVCGGKAKDKYKFTPDCSSPGEGANEVITNSISNNVKNTLTTITPTNQIQLSIFPNPVQSQLNLVFNNESPAAIIRVYNQIGQAMTEISLISSNDNSHQLNVNGFPDGVYFVSIRLENGKRISRKFVKY